MPKKYIKPKSEVEKTKFQFRIISGMLETEHDVVIYEKSLFTAIEKLNHHYFRCKILNCFNANHNPALLIPEVKNIITCGNMTIIQQLIRNSRAEQIKKNNLRKKI